MDFEHFPRWKTQQSLNNRINVLLKVEVVVRNDMKDSARAEVKWDWALVLSICSYRITKEHRLTG